MGVTCPCLKYISWSGTRATLTRHQQAAHIPVLPDLIYRKGRKPWEVIIMFCQEGYKAVMGTCGFIAGRFPVLRVDVPKCAPTMPWDGPGCETTVLVWAPEMCQNLQAGPGFSSVPVWPPQLLRVEWSENHCRTAMAKVLSSAALISARIGLVAHLEAQQSVLLKSYMTCQDNGLFAYLSISLCEDDKFIESNWSFCPEWWCLCLTWGELCQNKHWMKKKAGLQVLWNALTDILSWNTFARGLWLKQSFCGKYSNLGIKRSGTIVAMCAESCSTQCSFA